MKNDNNFLFRNERPRRLDEGGVDISKLLHQKTIEDLTERKNKEIIRINKINSHGGNRLLYAIDKLIEKSHIYDDQFNISSYDLGFGDFEINDLECFLNKLKKEQYFESCNQVGKGIFKISKPSIFALEMCKERIKQNNNPFSDNNIKKNIGDEVIKKMVFVRPRERKKYVSDDQYYLVINDKYNKEPIPINPELPEHPGDKYWGIIFRIAEGEKVSKNKGCKDFFNYQPSNMLYSSQCYKKTNILKVKNGLLVGIISLDVIDHTQYLIRKTKTLKLKEA